MNGTALVLAMGLLAPWGETRFQVKAVPAHPPGSLPSFLKEILADEALEISKDGTPCGHLFPVKVLSATATKEQVANGLTMDEVNPMQLLAVVQWSREMTDYRNLSVGPGTYTLRLACQPESDDHKDTAPGRFFGLLVPVAREERDAPTEEKSLLARAQIEGRKHASPWFVRLSRSAAMPLPQIQTTVPKHELLAWKQKVKTESEEVTVRMEMALWGPHQETP